MILLGTQDGTNENCGNNENNYHPNISILLISCTRNAEGTLTSIVGGTFSQHYNKAIEYYKQEKYDQAEKEFEEAIEIKPNDVYTLYGLGNTYYCEAKYGDAVKVFVKAININPDYAKVHYSLSLAYSKLEMIQEAEKEETIFRRLSKSKESPENKKLQDIERSEPTTIKNVLSPILLLLFITMVLIVFALTIKPLRKAIGLLLVILGFISCFTIVGMIIGIPLILIGGVLIFY